MPPESAMILLSFLSHRERSFKTFSMCAGFFEFAKETAAKAHRGPDGFEKVGGEFLGDEPDRRRAPIGSQ